MADDHYNQRIMVNAIICADLHKTVKGMGLLLLVLSIIGLSTVSANELKSLRKYKLLIFASWKMQYLTLHLRCSQTILQLAIKFAINRVIIFVATKYIQFQRAWQKRMVYPLSNLRIVTFFTIYYHDYSDMYFGCPSRTRLTQAVYCHYFLFLCNSF